MLVQSRFIATKGTFFVVANNAFGLHFNKGQIAPAAKRVFCQKEFQILNMPAFDRMYPRKNKKAFHICQMGNCFPLDSILLRFLQISAFSLKSRTRCLPAINSKCFILCKKEAAEYSVCEYMCGTKNYINRTSSPFWILRLELIMILCPRSKVTTSATQLGAQEWLMYL